MNERVEAFLTAFWRLTAGLRTLFARGLSGILTDREQLFRAQETNKPMKDKQRTHAMRFAVRGN